MADEDFNIRIPRWFAVLIAVLLLGGGGFAAGYLVGDDGNDRQVIAATATTTTTTTTTSTTVPFPGVGGGGGGNDDPAGDDNGGGAADDGGAAADPADPADPVDPNAATAEVSKSAGCPTVITWEGHFGTKGYTLQVYNALGNVVLYNGNVAGVGQKPYDCVNGVSAIGLVRFNANTDTGTVSDTAN
ncbi:MAG: hypothetical protein EXQ79_05940 [Acidimicrobiia bacterium]|nr:hypothetical protein [Acidimicrobiia bacterium]